MWDELLAPLYSSACNGLPHNKYMGAGCLAPLRVDLVSQRLARVSHVIDGREVGRGARSSEAVGGQDVIIHVL